jgi:methylated-DNA-[protein]-cysteine S-methyltransferase
MLFCTAGAGLPGLYFIGQPDCPPVAVGSAAAPQPGPSRPSPGAGELDGKPIRGLRIRKREREPDLFGFVREAGAGHLPLRFDGSATPGSMSELELLDADIPAEACDVLRQAHAELGEYFRGGRSVFSVPLSLRGTPFQRRVWQALLDIPYGEYVSYGQVALAAGMTQQHGRPVGTAVGQNPVSIIVPCHRVLAGNGRLNGYTGGLSRKVALLEIEGFEVSGG